MQPSSFTPRVHLFVCTNRRSPDNPLGTGCAERGDALFKDFKALVAEHGCTTSVWVTQTACLGICPRAGATVAVYPQQKILTEVDVADVRTVFLNATRRDP